MSRSVRARSLALCCVVVPLALLGAACGQSTSGGGGGGGGADQGAQGGPAGTSPAITLPSSAKPKTGGKLVYGLEAESDGLDNTKNRWALSGMMVAFAIYDPLFAYDLEGNPKPYLAESGIASDGFYTWTIKLRPNVVFHNGKPANSAALKKQFDALKASALTGTAVGPVTSVEIVDDLTVRVRMSQPWAAFTAVLTSQGSVLTAPETLDDPNGSRNPIGTGPFKLKEWKTDVSIELTRNDSYWLKDKDGQQLPYLSEVVFRPLTDAMTRSQSLEAGDVNMIQTNHWLQIAKLRAAASEGKLQYVPDTTEKEEVFVMFNTQKAPLDDPLLRQALAYATDRGQYADVVSMDTKYIADGAFEKGTRFYADVDFPHNDLDKAKELMTQYRAKHGDGPIEFKLGTTTTPENQRVVQVLAEQWARIGVTVQPIAEEQVQFIANAVFGKYDANLWRHFGQPDPDADYHWWIGSNAKPLGELGLNFARLKDAQIDDALNAGKGTIDEAVRYDAYKRLQKRWAELVPYIWLEHVLWVVAADNSVRNLTNNPLPDGTPSLPFLTGAHRLTATWLER